MNRAMTIGFVLGAIAGAACGLLILQKVASPLLGLPGAVVAITTGHLRCDGAEPGFGAVFIGAKRAVLWCNRSRCCLARSSGARERSDATTACLRVPDLWSQACDAHLFPVSTMWDRSVVQPANSAYR